MIDQYLQNVAQDSGSLASVFSVYEQYPTGERPGVLQNGLQGYLHRHRRVSIIRHTDPGFQTEDQIKSTKQHEVVCISDAQIRTELNT